jgi:formate dehydrogenase subunit gamma
MPPTPASAAEKTLHWLVAAAVTGLVATGAVMYVPALSQAVGQRFWVRAGHLAAAGAVALMPGVIAAVRWPEVRELERSLSLWEPVDVAWFTQPWRVFGSRGVVEVGEGGRFNGGQKLFAALITSALVILLVTGVPMYWWDRFSAELVARARELHVVLALALVALLAGHVYLGLLSPYGLLERRLRGR